MDKFDQFTDWAIELQSLAQAGLTYGHDKFDLERYQRIREIATEMMTKKTVLPTKKVRSLFCNDSSYPTPKIDTRAAIFKNDKILLVKESDGRWSLPGGWCEINLSPKENCIKETKEESGRNVEIIKLIAVHERNQHNQPPYAFGVEKFFFLCKELGGMFIPNDETTAAKYFGINELPELSPGKNNLEQVKMCFKAKDDPYWIAYSD